MNNILKIVREQVLDLLNDLDASIVKHEGHEYTEFHRLSEYFGVNKSNASRNRQDYPNLSVQLEKNGRKIWFIRIDFIPWWVAKSTSNHGKKSPNAQRHVVDFLSKIGIFVPEAPQYLYFVESEETEYIKIGVTANYHSGGRLNILKQTDGDCRELAVLQLDNAYEWEKKIHRLFSDLNVEGEWFRGDKKLIDFIDEVSKRDTN